MAPGNVSHSLGSDAEALLLFLLLKVNLAHPADHPPPPSPPPSEKCVADLVFELADIFPTLGMGGVFAYDDHLVIVRGSVTSLLFPDGNESRRRSRDEALTCPSCRGTRGGRHGGTDLPVRRERPRRRYAERFGHMNA